MLPLIAQSTVHIHHTRASISDQQHTAAVDSPKVAHLVVILQAVEAIASWCSPAESNTVALSQTNGKQQGLPEDSTAGLNLLELVDGWAGDVAIGVQEGRDVLQLLTNNEAAAETSSRCEQMMM